MQTDVSVIMSDYNTQKDILEQAIFSILNQSYKEFEFIIVADGNPTILDEIVNEISDSRIKVIYNNKNMGLPLSLNKAIEASSGKYLVRMDSDDISYPNRLQTLIDFIENNKDYSVVGSSFNLLTENNERYSKIYNGEIDKIDLMNRNAPAHPTVIMRKKDIIEVGMYETQNVKRCEDFVLWAKLLLNNKKIYNIGDILMDYRFEISDYDRRGIKYRKDEILNRYKYYKKLGGTPTQILSIGKTILAGLTPPFIMSKYHRYMREKG